MATYSFIDTTATLIGPGGEIDLSYGAGIADEGITITMTGDKNTMTIGADGEVMHSLHADKSGTATVRLLKTSPTNAKLQNLYNAQSLSSTLWGQNIINIGNTGSGDNTVCRSVAFLRKPNLTYAKDGDIVEWAFHVGKVDSLLGTFS